MALLFGHAISIGKKGYVDFINGVKDGMSWDEALAEKYKAPKERLLPAFAQAMQVKLAE